MKAKPFLPSLLLFLLVMGCTTEKESQEGQEDNLNRFQECVTQVTHGIISAQSDVRMVFNEPVVGWENGDELDSDVLSVSPNVKGKVIALDGHTLAFIPEKGFEQDTEYRFSFDLEAIVKGFPEELETPRFSVKTLTQQFNIYTDALQSYSREKQYLTGQLRLADEFSVDKAKTLVSAEHNGKTGRFKIRGCSQKRDTVFVQNRQH